MGTLIVNTKRNKEVVDITDAVNELLKKDGASAKSVHLFVLHTTAALSTADLDEGGTDLDYLDAFEGMVPRLSYRHPHNPEHMSDHILASMIGPSLTLPAAGGALALGMWQRVVLFEFDGPRERCVAVSFS